MVFSKNIGTLSSLLCEKENCVYSELSTILVKHKYLSHQSVNFELVDARFENLQIHLYLP